MSMVSELTKRLRKYAAEYDLLPFGREIEGTSELLLEAADTIETLCEKLQVANMDRREMQQYQAIVKSGGVVDE